MFLKIISASKKIYEGEVSELTVPGGKGEMVILPQHAGLVTTLNMGVIRLKHEGLDSTVLVNGGFLHVEKNEVIILADEAVEVKELIAEEIDNAIKKAEEKKVQSDISEAELIQLEKQLQFERFKKEKISA